MLDDKLNQMSWPHNNVVSSMHNIKEVGAGRVDLLLSPQNTTRYPIQWKKDLVTVFYVEGSILPRVYFSRDYISSWGDRYVLAYICAKNLNLIIWHLLHMCYPNKNRFILIFSLLTYCANLCLQFANLCLQFCVIIFRQIFDSALPWAVCCAGVLFI